MATTIATQTIFGERAEIFGANEFYNSAAVARPANEAGERELANSGWLARIELRRVWMWRFLAVLAASQIYFLREILGAYLIFAAVFAAVAALVVGVYMMAHAAHLAVTRLSQMRRPVPQLSQARQEAQKAA
ncbi:MAG TPA: hypothetical protein VJN93_12880 [Candidatus Acidoferrum sp.]|nr:hypothetical protein [Candidatus Acidoferrum sp.]